MGATAAFLVDLGHHAGLTAEDDLSVVLEVDLHDFVGESEHDCVFGAHPLLDLDFALGGGRLDELHVLVSAVQLTFEVLQQSHFFVQIFGVLLDVLFLRVVVALCSAALDLVKNFGFRLHDDFGGVVEEYSAGSVGKQLAEALLGTLVDPFAHPHVGPLADRLAAVVVQHVRVLDTHGQCAHAPVAIVVLAFVLVLIGLVLLVFGVAQSQWAVRVEKHFFVVVEVALGVGVDLGVDFEVARVEPVHFRVHSGRLRFVCVVLELLEHCT